MPVQQENKHTKKCTRDPKIAQYFHSCNIRNHNQPAKQPEKKTEAAANNNKKPHKPSIIFTQPETNRISQQQQSKPNPES